MMARCRGASTRHRPRRCRPADRDDGPTRRLGGRV